MGWTPKEVRETSLKDFSLALDGWRSFNIPGDANRPDFSAAAIAELDAIVAQEEVARWTRKAKIIGDW